MKKHKNHYILEIAYDIELQYEPDTRVMFLASGGLWRNSLFHKGRPNKKSPYERWIESLVKKATKIYNKNKEDFE